MKKIICIFAALLLLTGCGVKNETEDNALETNTASSGSEILSDADEASSSAEDETLSGDIITTEYFVKEFDLNTGKINEDSNLKINCNRSQSNNTEQALIEHITNDSNGWKYRTGTYETGQASAFSGFCTHENNLFFKMGGSLVCFDISTGQKLWSYWGAGYGGEIIFDSDKIYTWGFDGPRLAVLNKDGRELHRIETADYYDTDKILPFGDKLYVTHYGPHYGITEFDMQTMNKTGFEIVTECVDGEEGFRSYIVRCMNNGEQIWATRTTPVNIRTYHLNFDIFADESRVYITTNNVVTAYDKYSGKKLWIVGDLDEDGVYKKCMDNSKFYYCDGSGIVAVDKNSGERLWNVTDTGRARISCADGYVCASEPESGKYLIVSDGGKEIARGELPGAEVYGISVCNGKIMMDSRLIKTEI
ncbi:MAG: PQQ-binding-like beta-propeller repeat protein [Clostridia bacterium]|nr:PQQ-binding-like beta-propeller repeat protein [Clostridia bacterium]